MHAMMYCSMIFHVSCFCWGILHPGAGWVDCAKLSQPWIDSLALESAEKLN